MKKALAICGQICSGKSSVIKELSISYGWDIVSFGRYIRSLIDIRQEAPTRATYQSLGQKLFAERGPKLFLQDTIEFNQPASAIHIFDGVRHVSIIEELKEFYASTFVIYLNVSDLERYNRFISRASKDDPIISYDQFLAICQHPIEQGITQVASIANTQINAAKPFQDVMAEVKSKLRRSRFIS